MRPLLPTFVIALSLAACGGGSWGIGFEDSSMPTAVPGATGTVSGTFNTAGSYNGKYTLTATPNGGADTCEVAANSGSQGATIHVDTSSGDQTIKLVVTMNVNKTATLQADCKVRATSDDDPSLTQGADASLLITHP